MIQRFACRPTLLLFLLVFSLSQARFTFGQEVTHVTIGPSVAPLYGPWKFTVGDSPVDPMTHAPLWASPDFNDLSWETVDLTPKGIDDPMGGFSDYVKG